MQAIFEIYENIKFKLWSNEFFCIAVQKSQRVRIITSEFASFIHTEYTFHAYAYAYRQRIELEGPIGKLLEDIMGRRY